MSSRVLILTLYGFLQDFHWQIADDVTGSDLSYLYEIFYFFIFFNRGEYGRGQSRVQQLD